MQEISRKEQHILEIFLKEGGLSSSDAHTRFLRMGENISLVTVKRDLSRMAAVGFLDISGKGRSRTYQINTLGRLFTAVDAHAYCAIEPDKRYGLDRFNFDLLPAIPSDIFAPAERSTLERATMEYRARTTDIPPALARKELERLVIELSWKSSKIEGNTYTLLDTEKLILEHKEAPGHDKKEALMILNHKDAFTFIRDHAKEFTALTRANTDMVHRLLVKDLSVGFGLREKAVGVTGSTYRPLDNAHQIREAVDALGAAVARMQAPYAKALIALLGISYIQPFEDGNKRTARLMADALLLAHECAPLSYRSVEENDYRETILVWYELNSLVPFKRVFIEQYLFAAKNYAIAKAEQNTHY